YTYTVTSAAPCTNASATVTVAESGSPDAGTDGAITVCASGASIDLFAQLGGTPDAGGTWSGPSAVVGGQYDPTIMAPGVYTYTLNATAPCVADQSTVTVTENAAPDAGSNGTLTVCETGSAVSLSASLGGTPDAGGAWTGPSAVLGGNYDPATMTPGVYTYTVTGVAPCTNTSATVTVAETGSPDAGTDGAITVCASGVAIDLFTELGGTPDAGGTWSGPSAVVGGQYDATSMTPGVYTYTLNATAPCVADQSTVTVTENAAPDAGTNGTLTVCETGGAVNLVLSLGGSPDAGGAWTGPSAVVGGNYDPATMTPGVYTYTVTGAAPCTNTSATVTVAETGSPDAGTDGAITVCASGVAIDLFAQLGGTPDAGGTWSGPSAVVGGQYDPTTMAPGVYTYTLSATAPCTSTSSAVVVAEGSLQTAGDDATILVCASSGVQDLFVLLGPNADAGGEWTGPAGSFSGSFDPSTDPSGAYTYSFAAAACPADQATVQVTLEEGANAGGDASIALCSTNGTINLIDQLAGTPDATGTWTDANGDAVPGTFDPATSPDGEFTYTVPPSGNCPADQSTLTIVVNLAPNAGISGGLSICASASPVSLFDGLTGTLDAGGVWTDPDGNAHGTVVDPSIDLAGVYTYTVAAVAPCLSASSTVTVFIAPVADAGSDASTVQCSSADAFIMTALLNGTPEPDGVWRSPSGDIVPAAFAPASGTPGTYTYTVAATAPCLDDVSQLTIAISEAVDAGSDASISLCENSDTTVDLFGSLGGTPDANGFWTAPNGDAFSGVFDPASDEAGTYTYSVIAPAPCPSRTADVVVDVVPIPVAEFVVEGAEACTPVTITLSTSFQGGTSCSWLLWNGEQIDDCAPITRTITEGGTYGATLIVDAGNGCGTDTLSVPELFTVFDRPTADFTYVPEVINTLAPDVLFNNASENAIGYIWNIAGDSLTDEDPGYSFEAGVSGEYLVCLTAIASEVCRDSICKVVPVEDGLLVHVPNAFTPDGVAPNDIFKPIILGVEPSSYRFYVFDRWGQPLFETSDPEVGWNGLFADGTEVPIGVYVWKLVAKDRITANRIERVGHVTLVR
ncbi:MAG: gliding motility-associated C-terminal domain-containing protein, partial [Flavobacteriales bacterium]